MYPLPTPAPVTPVTPQRSAVPDGTGSKFRRCTRATGGVSHEVPRTDAGRVRDRRVRCDDGRAHRALFRLTPPFHVNERVRHARTVELRPPNRLKPHPLIERTSAG